MKATRTKTDIINLALSFIGDFPLQQAQGLDLSALELPANTAYENVLAEMLEQYPWSFAIVRKQLVRLGDPPTFGFQNQYQIPSDAMYFVGLYASDDARVAIEKVEYELEGSKLLTDLDEVFSRFVTSEVEPYAMSESFVTALAYGMAARMARAAQGEAGQISQFESQYARYREAAYLQDTASAGINQIEPPNFLLKARE